jgi:hypothetical protein
VILLGVFVIVGPLRLPRPINIDIFIPGVHSNNRRKNKNPGMGDCTTARRHVRNPVNV